MRRATMKNKEDMMLNRETRLMEFRAIGEGENEEKSYKVEGYASTFEPYVLFEQDGVQYSERIEPTAFDDADLSDVVFRVDHVGPVYARTSAGSVELWVDEHGLGQRTDLGRTQRSRDLFEDIKAGNYPKMSFAFTVADDGDSYDRKTHTRTISRIAKVFDIAAVSFPANPTTELSVSTRDYFDGVIEMEKAERLEEERREIQKQKIRIMNMKERI
jgi:HK97 family phage prohead protease